MLHRFALTQEEIDRNFKGDIAKSLDIVSLGGKGAGLVAAHDIPTGSLIWIEVGYTRMTPAEVRSLPRAQQAWLHDHIFEAAPDVWVVPQQIEGDLTSDNAHCNAGCHMNHSCDPNTLSCEIEMPDGQVLYGQYTIKPIAAGQEVTYAYHTSETGLFDDLAFGFHCSCGSSHCVGTYSTTDHAQQKQVLERLARQYGPYGVLPHVLQAILTRYPDANIGANYIGFDQDDLLVGDPDDYALPAVTAA